MLSGDQWVFPETKIYDDLAEGRLDYITALKLQPDCNPVLILTFKLEEEVICISLDLVVLLSSSQEKTFLLNSLRRQGYPKEFRQHVINSVRKARNLISL